MSWSTQLQAVRERPLRSCAGFPIIARRFEAWWQQQVVDRPLFLAIANRNPLSPVTRRTDLLEHPEHWLEAKVKDLRQTAFFADAVPHIRVDFGPALLGALVGARVEFSSDTAWTHACIRAEDWSDAPSFRLTTEHKWWKQLQVLLDVASAAAKDDFLVCTPSLGSLPDVLTNLRGATEICMDVIDQPERIIDAMDQLDAAWRTAFLELYRRVIAKGAGLFHWLLLWSDVPYVVTECDLGFSIGPEAFARVCLPNIAATARTVGRSVFHLDGAGSTRHLDALLEVPEIRAIQYTPGAGSPSATVWLEMFRTIQRKGRSLLVFAPADEVLPLVESLRPEGLAVFVEGPARIEQLQAIESQLDKQFGVRAIQ
jgi:hypothetical protein